MAMTDDGLERITLRKAALRLTPLLTISYLIAYLDRVNISFAALQMNQDLKFSAAVYGLGGGLFFLGYAFSEIPSNLLLVKFGPRRWIARIMLTWGVLSVGMMFVRTPAQFYVMRALLGMAEAGFFPGVVYYLTLWFPRAHRGRAISRFYVASPLSALVGGAVAGSLLGLQGKLGLAGWQWLFLVEGMPAVLMSLVIWRLLPDKPADVSWLEANEKDWLARRLAAEAAAVGDRPEHSLLRALRNPFVLVMGAVNFLTLGATYAFTFSAPIILKAVTHLESAQVGYLVAIGGGLGVAAMLLNGWHSDHSRERFIHMAAPMVLMAASFVVMSVSTAPVVVMAAYLAAVTFSMGVSAIMWLIPAEQLRPREAAVGLAAINSIGQVGSFLAPTIWGLLRDGTGSYDLGLKLLPAPFLLAALIIMLMRRGARQAMLPSSPGAGS